MFIEVKQGVTAGQWYWRIKASNRRIIADAEAFVSKGNAIRAAKNVVRGVIKRYAAPIPGRAPVFSQQEMKDGTTRIHWG